MMTIAGRLTLSASPARGISGAVHPDNDGAPPRHSPNHCERSSGYFANRSEGDWG